MIVILDYLKNERFEKKNENPIQEPQPEIPDNQLINRGKNTNHERSENIIKKLMYLIRVAFVMIIYIYYL